MKDNNIKIKIIRPRVEEEIQQSELEPVREEIFNAPIPDSIPSASTNIWKKIAKICLYVLTGLVPLFFLPISVAPVEINKQVFATILALVAFLCYLIDSFNRRTITYPKSLISLAVLFLLVLTGLSAGFSLARENALFGNFIQADTFLTFAVSGLIFFLAAVYIKKDDLRRLGFYFFGGFVLTLILGLFQIFGKFILPWDFSRTSSFNSIGSVNGWGIFISFGLVMIIAALNNLPPFGRSPAERKLSKPQKIILALVGLLAGFALIVLSIQMLWVSLGLAMLLLLLLKFTERLEMNLPIIVIVICLFFILINQQLPSIVNLPLEARPNISTTISVVKGIFIGAKQILFGSGLASFGYDWRLFRPSALNQTLFWSATFNQGFSFAFTLLATLGIFGILTLLFIIFAFIRGLVKKLSIANSDSIIVIAGLSYLLINLFVFPASFTQLFFIFLLLGIFICGSEKNYEINFHLGSKLQKIRGLIAFLLVIFLLVFAIFMVYVIGQKYVAAVYYQKGLLSSSLDDSTTNFARAADLDPRNDIYLRALSNALSVKANNIGLTPVSGANTQSLTSQLQDAIASAVSAGTQAVQLNSLDSLNWSNLGIVYENLIPINGAESLAEQNYNKTIELDPNNPQAEVDLARMFVVSADRSQQKDASWQEKLNKAQSYLGKALALKSDYAPAHFLMAQIYFREGDTNATIRKITDLTIISPSDPGLFFQLGLLYYRNNQTSQAQSAFENAIALDQNYSNARYFLGLIYDANGQKQKAIDQFEKIGALNPDNAEIKNILDNLKNGKSALSGLVPPATPPAQRTQTPVGSKQ